MEVPPPFAILQASRGAKRTRISWQVEPRGSWWCAGALGKEVSQNMAIADEGGGGVSQMLTIADEGGRGGKPNADDC